MNLYFLKKIYISGSTNIVILTKREQSEQAIFE